MDDKEKRKNDQGLRLGWNKSLKQLVGLTVVALILGGIGMLLFAPDVLIDLFAPGYIQETPDADTQQFINFLVRSNLKPPNYIGVGSGQGQGAPICVYVDMKMLDDYAPEDLIRWSEMSLNMRRLPADQVQIMFTDANEHLLSYEPVAALEMCFNRGVRGSTQKHLMKISIRDTPTHEILTYTWVVGN